MEFNYIQLMKDLGYYVNSLKSMESEKTIWFRKKENEYTRKDIMIDFEKEWISCQTSYYLKNGNLGKRESLMTFTEFEYIKGILEQGFDEQLKVMKGE